jgi:hypothetical protein
MKEREAENAAHERDHQRALEAAKLQEADMHDMDVGASQPHRALCVPSCIPLPMELLYAHHHAARSVEHSCTNGRYCCPPCVALPSPHPHDCRHRATPQLIARIQEEQQRKKAKGAAAVMTSPVLSGTVLAGAGTGVGTGVGATPGGGGGAGAPSARPPLPTAADPPAPLAQSLLPTAQEQRQRLPGTDPPSVPMSPILTSQPGAVRARAAGAGATGAGTGTGARVPHLSLDTSDSGCSSGSGSSVDSVDSAKEKLDRALVRWCARCTALCVRGCVRALTVCLCPVHELLPVRMLCVSVWAWVMVWGECACCTVVCQWQNVPVCVGLRGTWVHRKRRVRSGAEGPQPAGRCAVCRQNHQGSWSCRGQVGCVCLQKRSPPLLREVGRGGTVVATFHELCCVRNYACPYSWKTTNKTGRCLGRSPPFPACTTGTSCGTTRCSGRARPPLCTRKWLLSCCHMHPCVGGRGYPATVVRLLAA